MQPGALMLSSPAWHWFWWFVFIGHGEIKKIPMGYTKRALNLVQLILPHFYGNININEVETKISNDYIIIISEEKSSGVPINR